MGDRTKVLEEQPLADHSLAIFLEDVIMANGMEEARIQNATYQNGLKVYRHQSYTKVYSNLQNARKEQEKYTYHDLTKGFRSDTTPELRKLIMEASSDLPEQEIGILEVADGGGCAPVSGYKGAASEVSSTVHSVSQEQGTILAANPTVFKPTSTISPMPLAHQQMLNVRNASTGGSHLHPFTTTESANGIASDASLTSNKVQAYAGASQAEIGEAMEVGIKDTKSAPAELSSTKKSKKKSKSKKAKKGKVVENADEPSPARAARSLDCAEPAPEQHIHAGIEVKPEAHARTQCGK